MDENETGRRGGTSSDIDFVKTSVRKPKGIKKLLKPLQKQPTTEQLHNGPVVTFPVTKVGKGGKRQPRTLAVSNQGVSNLNGKITQWFFPPEDVHKIEAEEDTEQGTRAITLTVLQRYVFEADDAAQARRLVETCYKLQLGHNLQGGGQFDENLTLDDFDLSKVIGKGSFGKVLLAERRETGDKFAMKVLDKEELFKRDQIEHIKTEHAIMSTIEHPYMVRLHYSFQTSDKLYMCLDYVDGGELFYHLKHAGKFPEELAKFYIAEICLVLSFLHQHNIVYRDLKPENVLLTKTGHIKITDFGLAKSGITSVGGKADGQTTKTFCGTPEYLAPEVLTGIGHGQAVDWWSAGILLYEMLTGMPPFYSNNRNEMYILTIKGELEFPDEVSEEAREVLLKFLDRDPEQRLGSTEGGLEALKKYAFFADVDWDRLSRGELDPPMIPETLMGYDDDDIVTDEEDRDSEVNVTTNLRMESMSRESEYSEYSDGEYDEEDEEYEEGEEGEEDDDEEDDEFEDENGLPKKTIMIESDSDEDDE